MSRSSPSIRGASRTTLLAICALGAPGAIALGAQTPSPVSSAPTDALAQRYTVMITTARPLIASVRGRIRLVHGTIVTGEGGADQFARHWAAFTRDLRVTTDDGRALTVTPLVDTSSYRGMWTVNQDTGFVTVTYDVDLGFAAHPWPPSNEKAGYYDGAALYVVTKPLFIGSDSLSPVTVRFDIPAGWRVATAWNANPRDARTFDVTALRSLQQNTIVVGRFATRELQLGDFHFTLALLGAMRRDSIIAGALLGGFARSYHTLFPRTPRSSYLMTMFYGPVDNGESYDQSAAFVTAAPITRANAILWGNTQGHELMHFWTGSQIAGVDHDESAWLEEGFTEYYTNLALAREHLVPWPLFVKKMENNLGKYVYFRTQPQFDTVSIRHAGHRKTTNRFGVYNGGWAVAFGLDMTIRERTAGRRSLDDLMALLYDRYGLTRQPYTYDDVIRAASDVAGTDVSEFFRRYIAGLERMPIERWLVMLGFEPLVQDYAEELYLIDRGSTPLRASWLRQDP